VTLVARVGVRRPAFGLDVELTAAAGEVVAVLGPNGAGKSTLLRALAGLQPLDTGRVVLDGRVLDDAASGLHVRPPQRGVALVPQDGQLFPHLSARDNVAFGPRSRGQDRRTAGGLADEWLARLGLGDLGDRRPAALSGGQAARVALARALVGRPRLVLLDEPLAALDVGTRAQVRSELRTHLHAVDAASLLVTHDALDAVTVADRLVVLEGGQVVQQGLPAEVARRPATAYVARLVGVNLWSGTADRLEVSVDGGGVLHLAEAAGPGPVLVSLRPSGVVIGPARPVGSARNAWPGTVTAVEVLAGRARVSLDGPPAVLADVTVEAVAALRLAVGDRVWASCKATELEVESRSVG